MLNDIVTNCFSTFQLSFEVGLFVNFQKTTALLQENEQVLLVQYKYYI